MTTTTTVDCLRCLSTLMRRGEALVAFTSLYVYCLSCRAAIWRSTT